MAENVKPMNWARKSEIAERAETLEAVAEAKKKAEEQMDTVKLIIDYGVRENGVDRDPTPEERAQFESWGS